MGEVMIMGETMQSIANAIRDKNGSTDTYTPVQMAAAIEEIGGGGGNTQQYTYNGNWARFWQGIVRNVTTYGYQKTDGESDYYSSYSSLLQALQNVEVKGATDRQFLLCAVGIGNSAPSRNDYTLTDSGLTLGSTMYASITTRQELNSWYDYDVSDTAAFYGIPIPQNIPQFYKTMATTYTNNTDNDITITEQGLIYQYASDNKVLLSRGILSTPITVAAGESYTFNYILACPANYMF